MRYTGKTYATTFRAATIYFGIIDLCEIQAVPVIAA